VSRVTQQSVLADIAKNDKDSDVRRDAVKRVTDQSVLADIAKNDKDSDVRTAAVERVTDQSVLADMAKNDKNDDVRTAAVKRLDPALHADILPVLRANPGSARTETNLYVLGEIAKYALSLSARMEAVRRVRALRREELERVTDQSVLADIAKNDESYHVRWAAVKRVTEGTARDLLSVEIASQILSNPRLVMMERQDAEMLIDMARVNPRLLREKWDILANTIQHMDQDTHSDSGMECGLEMHGDDHSHTDGGFRGLTFPPKPRDF
jgi:hypothetical protein